MTDAAPTRDRILVEMTVAAPIEELWDALKDPAKIYNWHGWDDPSLKEEVEFIYVNYGQYDDAAKVLPRNRGQVRAVAVTVERVDAPAAEVERVVAKACGPGLRKEQKVEREVGVDAVHREMFGSSVDLARDVFVGLGLPFQEARRRDVPVLAVSARSQIRFMIRSAVRTPRLKAKMIASTSSTIAMALMPGAAAGSVTVTVV